MLVNEGQVSRLITKPCDPDQFREVVNAGLTQLRRIQALATAGVLASDAARVIAVDVT